MHRALTLVIIGALLAGANVAPSAAGGKKRKTVTEEWQAVAAPFPGADDHSDPATECGVENVTYTIHGFSTPGKGTLTARIRDFEGEWDLYVTDADGTLLGSSVNFMAGPQESVTLRLPAKAKVRIYACNFLGGPTAAGDLRYVYRR
ncbi:MAG: hypothetical protein M3280_03315 [Actinomycetota bacterium]|nr:hypothetical protein [Actinomycetota bacterium]